MSNPALELAAILEQWQLVPSGHNVYESRGGSGGTGDLAFWKTQAHAVELLGAVLHELSILEAAGRRVEHWRRPAPEWAAACFAPNFQWNSTAPSGGHRFIERPYLDALHSLGEFLDVTATVPALELTAMGTSRQALSDVVEMLSGLGLNASEKRYVFGLIDEVRSLLDSAVAGVDIDLVHRIYELFGYLTDLADELDGNEQTKGAGERIREAARRVFPWVVGGARVALAVLGGGADLQQLTDGS